jgi:predicted heme/steroid binding protein
MYYLILALLPAIIVSGHQIRLTETELRNYDGTDASQPIYLAINHTIYDVSASPSFYGPGGNYHHLTARDASRAWVSECWNSEDQLTWRMDGIEQMFMPRYLDEELEKASKGGALDLNLGGLMSMFPREQIAGMAEKAVKRLGTVSAEQKAARRKKDRLEVKQKVHDALAHWVGFFANNAEYEAVGKVVLDHNATSEPPKLCQTALEKRPLNGGLLDAMMDVARMGRRSDGKAERDLPDFIKQMYGEQQPAKKDGAKDEL